MHNEFYSHGYIYFVFETGQLKLPDPSELLAKKAKKVKPDPGENDENGGKSTAGDGPDNKPNRCPKCTRVFQYVKRFEQHLPKCDGRLRLNKVYVPKKPWEKVNKRKEKEERGVEICPLCLKQWNSYLKPLENHVNMHRERIHVDAEVKCPECPPPGPADPPDKNVFKKIELNKHFQEMHQAAGVGICCECFQGTYSFLLEKEHLQRQRKVTVNIQSETQ